MSCEYHPEDNQLHPKIISFSAGFKVLTHDLQLIRIFYNSERGVLTCWRWFLSNCNANIFWLMQGVQEDATPKYALFDKDMTLT